MAETGALDFAAVAIGRCDDPYPGFHALRAAHPVFKGPADTWYLSRHADVAAVLHDRRFQRQSPGGVNPISVPISVPSSGDARAPTAIDRMLSRWMEFIDPPAHTRLRRLVGTAFTPRLVAGLRGDIRAIADQLLDNALEAADFDVIADFAYPLPVIVVSRILGVPAADYGRLKDWSGQLTGALDSGDPDELAGGIRATAALTAYMAALIAARRRRPRAALISTMLADSAADDALSDDELLANCVFLLWAGHETTKNLIGNGTLALVEAPGELARLIADPGLMESAVDEFLRYESPIQKIGRWTREAVTLGGVEIPAGHYVVSLFGAANRDPAQFCDPDRLDVARRGGHGVAFGKGIHHCLGYGLAMLEGVVAFEALLERVSDIGLRAAAPQWQANSSIRGLESLPVSVRRR
ncbi:MAG: cytochrome P450 [Kiloniellaceae bacterium]